MAGFHGDPGINNQPQGLTGLMGRVNKQLNEVKHERFFCPLVYSFISLQIPQSGPALLGV